MSKRPREDADEPDAKRHKGDVEDAKSVAAPFALIKEWKKCSNMGKAVVSGGRARADDGQGCFIALKTPVDGVPEDDVFAVDVFLALQSFRGQSIGLAIDLCKAPHHNTETWQTNGISYVNIPSCDGVDAEVPSQDMINSFTRVVKTFWNKNPSKSVAVISSFGFNCAGFFICSYLFLEEGWALDAAQRSFSLSRAPGIFKGSFLQALVDRNDPGEMLRCPSAPAWRTSFKAPLPPKVARRPAPPPPLGPTVTMTVKDHLSYVPGTELTGVKRDEIVQKASSLLGGNNVAFDVQALTSDTLGDLCKDHMVTWCAVTKEQRACTLLILGKGAVFVMTAERVVYVPNMMFPRRKDPHAHVSNTVAEGVIVFDRSDGGYVPRFLVHDLLVFEGNSLEHPRKTRLQIAKVELLHPRKADKRPRGMQKFSVRLINPFPVEQADVILRKWTPKLTHQSHGLLFMAKHLKGGYRHWSPNGDIHKDALLAALTAT